jgi:L-lactate dehydrogenase
VVGLGAVGMAAAFAIMCKEIANKIALIDVTCEKVKGEVLDLKHGKQFLKHCEVIGSTDYSVCKDSDIVFVTAGARQLEGESRLNLVQKNVEIMKEIIPEIAKNSPNCILVMVSNPVDVLTYVAAQLSGFPPNRVIGTGTMLDSSRFRTMLGEVLGLAPSAVHAYIIGEHGDTSVPVWSKTSIAGVPLTSVNPMVGKPGDPENFGAIHQNVIDSAYEIIKLKGYTAWAIGLTCYALAHAILTDSHTIYPLSVNVKGLYGILDDVYLSLPALVTSDGVTHVIPIKLDCEEETRLRKSASTLLEVCRGIRWCGS